MTDRLAPCFHDPLEHWAGRLAAYFKAVHLPDRKKEETGPENHRLLGVVHVVEGDGALLRRNPQFRRQLEQALPRDAAEDVRGIGGDELSVFHDEKATRSPLGHVPLVILKQNHMVGPCPQRLDLRQRVAHLARALELGLKILRGALSNGSGGEPNARSVLAGHLLEINGGAKHRDGGIRAIEPSETKAIGSAARDDLDESEIVVLGEKGKISFEYAQGHGLHLVLRQTGIDPHHAKGPVEPVQVLPEQEGFMANGAGDIVYPITPQHSAVEDRDSSLALRQVFSSQVHDSFVHFPASLRARVFSQSMVREFASIATL